VAEWFPNKIDVDDTRLVDRHAGSPARRQQAQGKLSQPMATVECDNEADS